MWKDLTMGQKSEVMRLAVQQGFSDLNNIREMYDTATSVYNTSSNNTYDNVPYNPSPKDVRYDNGGMLSEIIITPDRDYNVFLNSLPPNQRYGDDSFNTYRYWELHGKPTDFEAALKTNPPMYTLEDDGYYHADSVAYNKDNDTYEFMKSPDHPTVDLELLQYWNNPDLEEFRSNYGLDLDSNPYKYIRRGTTDKPLYAYGGPLGNIYQGRGNKSQKLKKPSEPLRFSNVADMIKHFEGFRATPYKDGRDKKTGAQWYSIGYGFNDSGLHRNIALQHLNSGKAMSRAEADKLIVGYIDNLDKQLKNVLGSKLYNSLTPGQKMAYIDTGYQNPSVMYKAARIHKNTGDLEKTARALSVANFTDRNSSRYHTFMYGPKSSGWDGTKSVQENLDNIIVKSPYDINKTVSFPHNNWTSNANIVNVKGGNNTTDASEFPQLAIDQNSPIYYHPVQDMAWTPPGYSTPPTESIAPAIMETPTRPIIVDALAEDTTPTIDFDKMWASIFPQVKESTPTVVTPYEQFMTLQSRPRRTVQPTSVIMQPTPIVDDNYLLFEPMSTLRYGGKVNKFGGGGKSDNGQLSGETEFPEEFLNQFNLKYVPLHGFLRYIEGNPDRYLIDGVPLSQFYINNPNGTVLVHADNDAIVTGPEIEKMRTQFIPIQPQSDSDLRIAQYKSEHQPLDWLTDEQKFTLSRNVMKTLETLAHGNPYEDHDAWNYDKQEYVTGMAQDTYLLSPDLQEKHFLQANYWKGRPGDYGLVRKAVGNRNLPIYQTSPDVISRNDVEVLPTIDDPYWPVKLGIYDWRTAGLNHSGSAPTALYIDNMGNVYSKSWDLNDYGGGTGYSSEYGLFKSLGAHLLDKMGSPVVLTTGLQKVSVKNIENINPNESAAPDEHNKLVRALEEFASNKGIHYYRPEAYTSPQENIGRKIFKGGFGGPEIEVYPKAFGGKIKKKKK